MQSVRHGWTRALAALLLLFAVALTDAYAQGAYSLSTAPLSANTTTSSNSFISFNMTATRPIRLHRFWNSFGSTGTTQVDIWAHPGGVVNANTGWICIGSAITTVTNTSTYVEIPVTLNFLMQPGQTWGFVLSHTSISVKYSSAGSPLLFNNSELGIDLTNRCAGTGTGNPTTGTTNFSFSLCYRQWCGKVTYDIASQAPNDAGISEILEPKDFCPGIHPVTVQLENFGTAQLSSATINWKLNGVAQTPVPWTGLLDTLDITSRRTSVTLNPAYNFANGVPYAIQAWTENPNGITDTVAWNDTSAATRQAALSGTYTIGGASPDYPTISAAVAVLNLSGVCGPVVYNIRPGTYNEQVSVGQVSGTSPTNTVTFQSETGVNTDVTLTYGGQSSTALHTLLLDGSDYLRFRNMTITGTNGSYARILTLQGGATNNVFEGDRIIGPAASTTSTNNATIYAYYSGDNNNEFNNNLIQNGSYGVYYFGSGTGTGQLITGMKFRNNSILDFYYYGVYLYYMDALEFTGNTVKTGASYTSYMVSGYYWYNQINITGNRIINTSNTSYARYGLRVYYAQAAAGSEGLIANNFISLGGTTTLYGMYLYYPYNQNVEFNTLYHAGTSTSGYNLYLYGGQNVTYSNNILYNANTGYVAYCYSTTWRDMDYNVFYTPYSTFGYWNGTSYSSFAAWQTASGMNANSISKLVSFKDVTTGDLHLSGVSQNDAELTGRNEAYITTDIDGDPRVLPYRGADEACYILPNTVNHRFVDEQGQTVTYGESGTDVDLELSVSFPDDAINLTVTVNFYSVPANQLVYTYTLNATKLIGQPLLGTYSVPVPGTLPSGYYRMDVVFNTKNSCGDYIDFRPGDKSMLIVASGQTPCLVWPGDVNNDGLVNYGDRASLNRYIFDANLRPSWLQGPARYRPDYLTNPMTYYTWEAQASAPWLTSDGCYMDADGNGVVNSYDMLPVKVNFMRVHGLAIPRRADGFAAGSFDLGQNYPNPFRPATTLRLSVPERSAVRVVVTDVSGREVAVLIDGTVEAGIRTLTFDAGRLESGVYFANATMTGVESGIGVTKVVKMTVSK